jgi:serine/threonine-protein kinase
LGRSPTSHTHLAFDLETEQQVVVKIFTSQLPFDETFLDLFRHEVEQVQHFQHPLIVPILNYGIHNRQPFLTSRFMPAGSLEDRLLQSSLDLKEIYEIIRSLADPLDEAHQQGLVHQNLKPSNLLVADEGQLYISDFGLPKMTEMAAMVAGTKSTGTPEYMSPEQIVGREPLDGRSDIYALGVILFQLLTGRLPFEADSPLSTMLAHLRRDLPVPAELGVSIPHGCEAVLIKAMAKDRSLRFDSVSELANVLELVLRGGGGSLPFSLNFPGELFVES